MQSCKQKRGWLIVSWKTLAESDWPVSQCQNKTKFSSSKVLSRKYQQQQHFSLPPHFSRKKRQQINKDKLPQPSAERKNEELIQKKERNTAHSIPSKRGDQTNRRITPNHTHHIIIIRQFVNEPSTTAWNCRKKCCTNIERRQLIIEWTSDVLNHQNSYRQTIRRK